MKRTEMTDADLLEYIERTPELKRLLDALALLFFGGWRLGLTNSPNYPHIKTARAFLAHEQRILAQRGTEPVAWMWQHDETGMTGFIAHCSAEDREQWRRLNPRRSIVAPLYAAPQPAVSEGHARLLRDILDNAACGEPSWESLERRITAMLSAAPKPTDSGREG